MMDDKSLDFVLIPLGLLVLGIYHVWLLYTIIRHPTRTVIGLNAACRRQWVYHIMSDQQKNGILGVQTIRNNLMASTLLATIAITLSSLISAVVSSSSISIPMTYTTHTIKYFSVLICFLLAFFCNMQCTRYYAHASFLLNVPSSEDEDQFVEYVAQTLNRGGLFWSLGLRAFYFSFPLLLWIFGPVPMFACSCLMAFLLYFLDASFSASRNLPFCHVLNKETDNHDLESIVDSIETVASEDYNLYCSLLGSSKQGSTTNATFT